MRAGIVLIILGIAMGVPARTHADADLASTIYLHPRVPTILHLPDEVVNAWIEHHGEIMVAPVGNKLYVRPRPGTAAGVEASLEVETRTMRRTFPLRVVRRARDATRDVLVLPPEAGQDVAEATLEIPPVTLLEPPAAAVEPVVVPVQPVVTEPASAPSPPPAEPGPAPPPAEPVTAHAAEPAAEPAPAATRPRRIELSLHGFAALAGTTQINIAGYEATDARQSHHALGLRLTGRRPGSPWGVEVNVSGESLTAPTAHARTGDVQGNTAIHVSGPWLRADGGLRMRFEASLAPTAYVGAGLQAHYRDIEPVQEDGATDGKRGEAMPFRGVLAVGLGLEHRVGNVLLGLELHVRQGVPADYRSVSWVLSLGFFLDRGE